MWCDLMLCNMELFFVYKFVCVGLCLDFFLYSRVIFFFWLNFLCYGGLLFDVFVVFGDLGL